MKIEKLNLKKNWFTLIYLFSAAKLRWLLDNDDVIREEYEKGDGNLMFGTVDTWLIYHLTKEKAFVSDITNASRTYFMDLETLDYDDDLLDFWGSILQKSECRKLYLLQNFMGNLPHQNWTIWGSIIKSLRSL